MTKIITFRIGKAATVEDLEPGLAPMQELVGGYIQAVPLWPGVDLICNENGKHTGLEPNRYCRVLRDMVAGDFFVSRCDDDGEMVDVTDSDAELAGVEFPPPHPKTANLGAKLGATNQGEKK